MTAILTHPAAYVLAWSLAWGLLSDLFGSDRGPERVQPAAVQTAMERIASLGHDVPEMGLLVDEEPLLP